MATKKTTKKPDTPPNEEEEIDPTVEEQDEETSDNPPTPEKTFTKTEVQKSIDRAVKAALKDKEKELETAQQRAELSETERLKAENDALKRDGLMAKAKDKIIKALEDAGANSPALLYNLKKGDLEFNDKGKITNLDDILDELKEEYSEQFGVEKPNETIDAGKGNKETPSVLSQADIDKMSQQELIDNMDKVDAFLASQK